VATLLSCQTMMTRDQRIDYEILVCILNAAGADGLVTTAPRFMVRLRELFPDIQAAEFTDACKRLFAMRALQLHKLDKGRAVIDDDKDASDVEFIFTNPEVKLNLKTSEFSQRHFRRLSALIEPPAGCRPNTRSQLRRAKRLA
jgi:hypothetical protein